MQLEMGHCLGNLETGGLQGPHEGSGEDRECSGYPEEPPEAGQAG